MVFLLNNTHLKSILTEFFGHSILELRSAKAAVDYGHGSQSLVVISDISAENCGKRLSSIFILHIFFISLWSHWFPTTIECFCDYQLSVKADTSESTLDVTTE